MKLNEIRQLAGLKYGWRRIGSNIIKTIVASYRTVAFFWNVAIIYVLLRLGIVRK